MNSHYNQNIKNKGFCQSFLLYYIEKIGITERNDKNILLEFNSTTFFVTNPSSMDQKLF